MLRHWLLPARIPPLARAQMPRELLTWSLLAVTLGVVEGGVLGVIVKKAFAGTVDEFWLHQAVALVSGAPAFANLSSLWWSGKSHGKGKTAFLNRLQWFTVAMVLFTAAAPLNAPGLLWFVSTAILARVGWAGVITLRATVWRANFPREVRATLAGRLAAASAVLMAGSGMLTGWLMNRDPLAYHWVFPLAALAGALGALVYRKVGMRGQRALVKREQALVDATGVGLRQAWQILRRDRPFRHYMIAMFVFGSGNLMVTAPLILILNEQGLSSFAQMMITSSLPLAVIPLFVPIWAKRLDASHIIPFRAFHSWFFVATHCCFALAAWQHWPALYWLAAVGLGISYAGGLLGWNLGHHDFAPPELAAQYMGIHVTLTGLRGLIMPVIGVSLYEWLKAHHPGSQDATLWLPWSLCLAGALLFLLLKRQYLSAQVASPRPNSATAQIRNDPGSGS